MSEERGKKKSQYFILVQMSFFVTLVLQAVLGWKEGGACVGAGQEMKSEAEIFKVTWEIEMLNSH